MSSVKDKVALGAGTTPPPSQARQRRPHYGESTRVVDLKLVVGCLIVGTLVLITFYLGISIGARFSTKHEPTIDLTAVAAATADTAFLSTDIAIGAAVTRSAGLRGGIEVNRETITLNARSKINGGQGFGETYTDTINPKGLSQSEFLSSSLAVTDNSFMTSPNHLSFKSSTIIAAWIYLDPGVTNDNMRTIFSNKKSGCDIDADRGGIAMFVNPWQGDNLRVYIEYGNAQSGCNKVESQSSLSVGSWTHLAAAVEYDKIRIYINGVEDKSEYLGATHNIYTKREFRIGHYNSMENGDLYPLYGNISTFAVVNFADAEKDNPSISGQHMLVQSLDHPCTINMHWLFTYKPI